MERIGRSWGPLPIRSLPYLTWTVRIQFVTPAVELPARDVQLSRQCLDVFAASQSLYCELTKLLRIPSLCHSQFSFLQSVSLPTVSFLGFTPGSVFLTYCTLIYEFNGN